MFNPTDSYAVEFCLSMLFESNGYMDFINGLCFYISLKSIDKNYKLDKYDMRKFPDHPIT